MTKVTKKGWAMSLGQFSGVGFLLSDGIELSYSAAGNAWARLPLVFKKSKKNDSGTWDTTHELKVDATVFGHIAEYLADNVTGRGDIAVTGELYQEEYEKKDGTKATALRMNVLAAAPVGRVREKVGVSAPSDDGVPF